MPDISEILIRRWGFEDPPELLPEYSAVAELLLTPRACWLLPSASVLCICGKDAGNMPFRVLKSTGSWRTFPPSAPPRALSRPPAAAIAFWAGSELDPDAPAAAVVLAAGVLAGVPAPAVPPAAVWGGAL